MRDKQQELAGGIHQILRNQETMMEILELDFLRRYNELPLHLPQRRGQSDAVRGFLREAFDLSGD